MVIAFLRTIILYLLIIAGIRLMGKRQVGELEPSELVLALIIADLAAVPMQDFGIPLLTGIIPILTLLCITMLLSVLTMHSVKFRALVCGRPSIIVENGRVLPYANQLPATAEQMNVTPDDVGLPLVIVNDGRVLDHNLRTRGLDHAWLDKQLKAHKLHNPRQVFLLTVDEQNRVYLVEKEALQ